MREYTFQEAIPQIRYCADCGKQINPRAEICPNCGVRQHVPRAKQVYRYTPNRTVAILLAILLVGGFGAHKFYMGQAGKGILYLFTSWLLSHSSSHFLRVFITCSCRMRISKTGIGTSAHSQANGLPSAANHIA